MDPSKVFTRQKKYIVGAAVTNLLQFAHKEQNVKGTKWNNHYRLAKKKFEILQIAFAFVVVSCISLCDKKKCSFKIVYQVNAAIAFVKEQGTPINATGGWDNRENETPDFDTVPPNGLA